MQGGLNSFLDYEIVELLLTLGTPRKDCKPMAKDAIRMFGGLKQVLDAPSEELQQIKGIGPSNIFGLKLFQAVAAQYAKEQILKRVPLNTPQLVAEFLQKSIGREKKEHFVMLALDSRNNLVKISNISVGTVNASLVHPREVFREAIQASAAQIIIAHNHPSDDPEASPEDVAMTRRLAEVANIIGIQLLDHVIVTKNNFSSLKQNGLM